MTIYVVPCGVSILDGLAKGRGHPVGAADGEILVDEARAWAERLRHGGYADGEVVDAWRDELADQVEAAEFPLWQPDVAAETNTLAHRGVDLDRPLVDRRVALLASDTAPGLASAMLVASRIAGDDLHRVRYTTAHGALGEHLVCTLPTGTVTVVRIVGLAPDASDGLRSGAAGLGLALRAAYDAAAGDPVEVHLTGGFKATLLHLLSMTELLHSLADSNVTAWYLYDDDPQLTGAVQIGLRQFTSGHLDRVAEELAAVRAGTEPPEWEFALEGAAWTRQDGQPKLNGFGTGYLGVLRPGNVTRSEEGG